MNRTTEGSNKNIILVGGETYALEDGTIEIPPEQAKTTKAVIENIKLGDFMEIHAGNCRAEDILSKQDIEVLKQNREERKTRKAVERKQEERS